MTEDEKHLQYQLAPVARLPDDVLGYIFGLLVTVDHGPNEPSPKSQISDCISKDAMRYASQVCTHWRYLSLGISTLWAHVDIGKYGTINWSKELIKRSHPAPLSIRCFDGAIFCDLVRVQDLTSRLYMIAAWYCDEMAWVTILSWSLLPSSNLAILSFNCPNLSNPVDGEFLPIEDYTLVKGARSFDELYFRDCRTNLNLLLLTNLRILKLENNFYGSDPRLHFQSEEASADTSIRLTEYELILALAQMPSLQELYLLQAFSNLPSPDLPYIHLPHLKIVRIRETFTGYSDGCSSLLSHIKFPSTCHFDITFGRVQLGPALKNSVLQILKRFFQTWDQSIEPSLTIDFSNASTPIDDYSIAITDSPWNFDRALEKDHNQLEMVDTYWYESIYQVEKGYNGLRLETTSEIGLTRLIVSLIRDSFTGIISLRISGYLDLELLQYLPEFIGVENLALYLVNDLQLLTRLLQFRSTDNQRLFPSLHMLVLIFTPKIPSLSTEIFRDLEDFLHSRSNAMVVEFRYTNCEQVEKICKTDMDSFLIRMGNGLKIREFVGGNHLDR